MSIGASSNRAAAVSTGGASVHRPPPLCPGEIPRALRAVSGAVAEAHPSYLRRLSHTPSPDTAQKLEVWVVSGVRRQSRSPPLPPQGLRDISCRPRRTEEAERRISFSTIVHRHHHSRLPHTLDDTALQEEEVVAQEG